MACVSDDEAVTQYGRLNGRGLPTFRDNARAIEPGMSLQRGAKSAEEMCYLVFGEAATEQELARACARTTRAVTLRVAGFAVIHTPSKVVDSGHCTAVLIGGAGELITSTPWHKTVTELFNSCFNEL